MFVGPLLAVLTSFVASAAVIVKLYQLKGARRMLMARQLWHLMLANFIECSMVIFWLTLEPLHRFFGIGSERTVLLDNLCTFSKWNNVAFMTSLFLEVHISAAAVAASNRARSVLDVLSGSLLPIWVFGSAVGALVALPSGSHWDSTRGSCNTSSTTGEEFKAYIIFLALFLCIMFYAIGMVQAWRCSRLSVQAHIWNRAKFFVLAALVCWPPFLVYTCANESGQLLGGGVGMTAHYVSDTFFFLNGAFNALAYRIQSNIVARRLKQRQAGMPCEDLTCQSQDLFGIFEMGPPAPPDTPRQLGVAMSEERREADIEMRISGLF